MVSPSEASRAPEPSTAGHLPRPSSIIDAGFLFEGGDPALDFVGTLRMREGALGDQLPTGRHVVDWLEAAGFASALGRRIAAAPPASRMLLDEARLLRGGIEEALLARTDDRPLPEPALLTLNRVLGSSRTRLELVDGAAGPALLEVETAVDVRALLVPVAAAAAKLLVGADPARIRQCDSGECVLWFLDTSKNGRRRWCSMARCGNRAKAARHYRRKKAAEG